VDIVEFLTRGNYNACIGNIQIMEPRKFESFANRVQGFTLADLNGGDFRFRSFPAATGR
jgi:hypothetical protein